MCLYTYLLKVDLLKKQSSSHNQNGGNTGGNQFVSMAEIA